MSQFLGASLPWGLWQRAGLGPGHPVSVTAFVPQGKSPLLHQEGRERMTRRSLKVPSAMTCVTHLPSL